MASDEYTIEDFPEDKLGEWVQVEADTHFMPVAFIDSGSEDPSAVQVRGIIQVESEQGSIAMCETYVPLPLVMRWVETEDDDE